jgi:hypothetical protein
MWFVQSRKNQAVPAFEIAKGTAAFFQRTKEISFHKISERCGPLFSP